MASGDVVGQITGVMPPAATFATADVRAGGSTPAETFLIWDFDAAADEFLDFYCVLNGYAATTGITIRIKWSASTATTGDVVWQAAIRRIADDAEDIDGAHTYAFNTVTATAANVSGEVDYTTITFTDGADMDSLADDEVFVLRIGRDANVAGDNMAGDAELHGILIEET